MDATIDANETAGFKYTPGGRESYQLCRSARSWADLIAILKGTVNDATSFPSPNAAHGSYHWAFERVLSASLIPVMGAAAVSTGSAYVSPRSFAGVMFGQSRMKMEMFEQPRMKMEMEAQ